MEWSEEWPVKEGWYWINFEDTLRNDGYECVRAYRNIFSGGIDLARYGYWDGIQKTSDSGYMFYGPIEPPPMLKEGDRGVE